MLQWWLGYNFSVAVWVGYIALCVTHFMWALRRVTGCHPQFFGQGLITSPRTLGFQPLAQPGSAQQRTAFSTRARTSRFGCVLGC